MNASATTAALSFAHATASIPDRVHVEECGTGSPVLCLHSSLGSCRQWRPLMMHLGSGARVLAADLHGYGRSPAWSGPGALSLDDELELLQPILDAAAGPVDLVGHSYGAAVAAHIALRRPEQVRSLILYEPVLFALLSHDARDHAAAAEIHALCRALRIALAGGQATAAARRFVDYWSGRGTFDGFCDELQLRLADKMPAVMHNFDAAGAHAMVPADYRALQVPTLLMHGHTSPAPVRRVVENLSRLIPGATALAMAGLGHMGPVTHPQRVNGAIAQFVGRGEVLAEVA
jgi:pimeloyl-ACP methyl ester carboxylesterase